MTRWKDYETSKNVIDLDAYVIDKYKTHLDCIKIDSDETGFILFTPDCDSVLSSVDWQFSWDNADA